MDSATTLAGADRRWSPRLWGLLVVLCGALFLDALDVSMVGVALPSIRADLGLSTASLQWVVSGYVLGYGGLLLLGGRAADLLGRRRVFLAALAVFAVASLLGGLVSTGPLLIAARLVKGMAAAFTAPAGLSIITTTFAEGPARNRALGIYSAFGAAGFSLGLVLSGLLTEISWRWTLLLPAPVAAVVLAAAVRLIPRDDPAARAGRRFDLPGAAAVTAGMLLLVYAVTGAPQDGWASARTLLSFAGAAALLGAFVLIERRSRDPAGPPGHLPLAGAGPREPRRHGAVRVVRLVPVPGHPVPADHGRLDGAGHRAGLPARRGHDRRRLDPDGPGHRPVRPGAGHRRRPSPAWPPATPGSCGSARPPTIPR